MQRSAHTIGRPLALIGASAGLFVLGFTVYWTVAPIPTAAPLEGRYGGNAVLAMELARTADELAVVIGRDPPSTSEATIRARLDRVNQLDFLYMAAYGALLVCGFVSLARARGDRRYLAGAALVVIAVVCDGVENRALLALTETGAEVDAHLASLRAATYVKWELLAAATALLGWALVRRKGWAWRVAGAIGLTAAPLGVLLCVDPATFAPLLTLSFVPVWLAVFADLARTLVLRSASPRG
jgi:hypothetical protein